MEYLDNQEFTDTLLEWRENPDGPARDRLVGMFVQLVTNLLKRYPVPSGEQDDAVQDVVMLLLSKQHTFDPARGKLFNWSTSVARNQFRLCHAKAGKRIKTFNRLKEREEDRDRENRRR